MTSMLTLCSRFPKLQGYCKVCLQYFSQSSKKPKAHRLSAHTKGSITLILTPSTPMKTIMKLLPATPSLASLLLRKNLAQISGLSSLLVQALRKTLRFLKSPALQAGDMYFLNTVMACLFPFRSSKQ